MAAWTYSADPLSSDRDMVRFEVGDTDSTRPLVLDTEIAYALAQEGNPLYAAAAICSALAAKFSREADRTMGRTSVSASQRAVAYRAQVKELRRRALAFAAPRIRDTASDRETQATDTETLKPAFTRELHEDQLDLMPTPPVSQQP